MPNKKDRQAKSRYKVGYAKPPKHSQFKKGESGNPKGRKKGNKNYLNILREELETKIMVQEGGVSLKLSKQGAITKRLVHKALNGDHRAIITVFACLKEAHFQKIDHEQQEAEELAEYEAAKAILMKGIILPDGHPGAKKS